jgi:hypothetical protein
MYESDAEVLELQAILDRSMYEAGAHMRSIFGPRNRLSARQVCGRLQGVKQVAAATTTARGEPRVAPIDAVFFKGRFYLSTDVGSVRARHLVRTRGQRDVLRGADPMIIVQWKASFVARDDPGFEALDAEWVKAYGKSITEISDGVRFIRVEPTKMFAYSLQPGKAYDQEERREGVGSPQGTIPSGVAPLLMLGGNGCWRCYGWTEARLSLVFGDLGLYRRDEPFFDDFALGGRRREDAPSSSSRWSRGFPWRCRLAIVWECPMSSVTSRTGF